MAKLTKAQKLNHDKALQQLGIDPRSVEGVSLNTGATPGPTLICADPKLSKLRPHPLVVDSIAELKEIGGVPNAAICDNDEHIDYPGAVPGELFEVAATAGTAHELQSQIAHTRFEKLMHQAMDAFMLGNSERVVSWEPILDKAFFPLRATAFAAEEMVVCPGHPKVIDPTGTFTDQDPYKLIIGQLTIVGDGHIIFKVPTNLTVQNLIRTDDTSLCPS